VSAGDSHTCGVKTDGTIACWGSNSYGKATPPPGTFTVVSAGYNHTCAVRTDGSVTCWGDNQLQQCTCGGVTMLGSG
jgi:alpha-tubulin suppressor-like RCC1 family protein